jgi:predicted ribosome quality control (RQC) complex YloA/Tae2 family protein
MSLNWKEIDRVLSELDLRGAQIQKIIQSAYDVISFQVYKEGKARTLLIVLSPGVVRLHETFKGVPKTDKPLRFAEFLKSRIVNGRIEEVVQLGQDRIVRMDVRRGDETYRLYIRLWSNAANLVVTDEEGTVLDAMRRSPKRGEITGGHYEGERHLQDTRAGQTKGERTFVIRELDGPGNFNERIDRWYAEQGGALSLKALREQIQRSYEGKIGRLTAAMENLRAKRAEYADAERLKQYGDIIMANLENLQAGQTWLEADNFYTGERVRIRLEDPNRGKVSGPRGTGGAKSGGTKSLGARFAEAYYEQYHKAKNGFADVDGEITAGQAELARLEKERLDLLAEENPLRLHKALSRQKRVLKPSDKKRPGLTFHRKEWRIIVGRDATENDDLLRHHVKGMDLWLHARDFPGSYVFIKARSGKSVPLDILIDAGHLALFYSKGRNSAEGDLFYTPVKFLRRAKNGPKGLVIPTQEKNLHIKLDEHRIKELELCRDDT